MGVPYLAIFGLSAICTAIFLVLTSKGVRDWRKNRENTGHEITYDLFRASYDKRPDKWLCMKYSVRYMDQYKSVDFLTYGDYAKYRKWWEKKKRQEQAERNNELWQQIQRETISEPLTWNS